MRSLRKNVRPLLFMVLCFYCHWQRSFRLTCSLSQAHLQFNSVFEKNINHHSSHIVAQVTVTHFLSKGLQPIRGHILWLEESLTLQPSGCTPFWLTLFILYHFSLVYFNIFIAIYHNSVNSCVLIVVLSNICKRTRARIHSNQTI